MIRIDVMGKVERAARDVVGGGASCWGGHGDNPKIFRIWSKALPGSVDSESKLLGIGTTPEKAWESAAARLSSAGVKLEEAKITLPPLDTTGEGSDNHLHTAVSRLSQCEEQLMAALAENAQLRAENTRLRLGITKMQDALDWLDEFPETLKESSEVILRNLRYKLSELVPKDS